MCQVDARLVAIDGTPPSAHEDILISTGQDGVDTDEEIYNYFIVKTKDEACTIVSQGQGCKCEAWRLLALWFDPKRLETKSHHPENLGDHRGVGQERHGLEHIVRRATSPWTRTTKPVPCVHAISKSTWT